MLFSCVVLLLRLLVPFLKAPVNYATGRAGAALDERLAGPCYARLPNVARGRIARVGAINDRAKLGRLGKDSVHIELAFVSSSSAQQRCRQIRLDSGIVWFDFGQDRGRGSKQCDEQETE
jgi:hypothetical protein